MKLYSIKIYSVNTGWYTVKGIPYSELNNVYDQLDMQEEEEKVKK